MKILAPTLLYIFVLFNCNFSQSQQTKSEKLFSKIKIKHEDSFDVRLTNGFGKKYMARVFFPKNLTNKNSLIIGLHWAGSYGTYKEFHDCLLLPGLQNINAILISLEGEEQLWNSTNNIEKVLTTIKNTITYWNVDPNKIAIMGYSNGGNGSWYFAEHYPNIFSAAIPVASSYPIRTKLNTPIYAIHGTKDELFPLSKTEKWVANGIKKGSNITFIKKKNLSHFQACAYKYELKNAETWLNNIWNKK